MNLESYTCENCILQRNETVYHLFLLCTFAKSCWSSIGIITPRVNCPQREVRRIANQIKIHVRREIIIVMLWSIWKCRNGWIFDRPSPGGAGCAADLAPTVGGPLPPNAFRL
jgi:hypothetical protein